MNESELRSLLERYNQTELAWGVGIALASVVLWLLSYALVALFVMLIAVTCFRTYPSVLLENGISMAVMAILFWDGIRYSGEVFDLDEYRNSFYSLGAGQHSPIATGFGSSGNPLQAAYGISQFLLCAPRSSVAAVRHLRAKIRIVDEDVRTAVELFRRLGETRDWVDVSSFGQAAATLRYLDQLELLWTRVEEGKAQVKLAPDARSTYLGA